MDTGSIPATVKSYKSSTPMPNHRFALKLRIVSATHVILLALSAILPVTTLLPVHAQNPTVSVDPNTVAAGFGSSFTINIDITDVPNVVGYDVTLLYNSAALSATSVDFNSPATLFGGLPCAPGCNLALISTVSNSLGEIRTARALLGGPTAQSPGIIMSITFTVTGSTDSLLTLDSVAVAQDVGGSAVPIAVTIVSGNFVLPPSILFLSPSLINPGSPVLHTHKAGRPVPVMCNIQLDPTAVRAGFGGCEIDVRSPTGVDIFADSGLAFFFPGQAANVTANFTFSSTVVRGTYTVFATALNCVAFDVSTCTLGSTTVNGLQFKMNP